VFGFIVKGTFVPTVLTYVYGAAQVSSLQLIQLCVFDENKVVFSFIKGLLTCGLV